MAAPDHPSAEDEALIVRSICHADNPSTEPFAAYLLFYRDTVCTNRSTDVLDPSSRDRPPVFPSHAAVVRLARRLGPLCSLPQARLQGELLPGLALGSSPDQARACLGKLARVAFMVDTDSRSRYSDGYRLEADEAFPCRWRRDQSLLDFFREAFPRAPEPGSPPPSRRLRRRLKAWKLHERYRVRVVATDDLAEHLVYNDATGTLSVFHQVAFLKQQVLASSRAAAGAADEEHLKRGLLPHQLALETLYSIYYILFPLDNNEKSRSFAESLVSGCAGRVAFDPGLLVYDGLVVEPQRSMRFVYWAGRLRKLSDMVARPPPKNRFIAWVDRRVNEREALLVAIVGLILAVVLGLVHVVLGVVQIVVTVLAWKYPVAAC